MRSFQLHLIEERKVGWSSVNQAVSWTTFHCFEQRTRAAGRSAWCPSVRSRRHCRSFWVGKKSLSLLKCVKSLKHRTFLLTLYAAGLRLNEAAELTIS